MGVSSDISFSLSFESQRKTKRPVAVLFEHYNRRFCVR